MLDYQWPYNPIIAQNKKVFLENYTGRKFNVTEKNKAKQIFDTRNPENLRKIVLIFLV